MIGPTQKTIADFLRSNGGSTAWQIHVGTGLPIASVRTLVRRMEMAGTLSRREVAGKSFHSFRNRIGGMGKGGVWLYEVAGV